MTRPGGAVAVDLRLRVCARDLMQAPVRTLPLESSGMDVAEVMARDAIRHVVVVDRRGRIAGIVSDRDVRESEPSALIVQSPALRHRALSLIPTSEMMAADVHTASPDTPLREMVDAMLARNISAVPIVDERDRPIGIVTTNDVMGTLRRLLEATAEGA